MEENSYYYEDCKSKPYVEPKNTIVQDDAANSVYRQIHELTNDLNLITEIYDRETDQIRAMMIDRGDEYRNYMAKHEAAYFIVTDQMDYVTKADYGKSNFERLGVGLAQIKFMTAEFRENERKEELGLYVAPEVVQEKQHRSLTEIMALSDKDKREMGYPVFSSNVDTERHGRVFEKRVEIEKDKLVRQADKGIERDY